MSNNVETSRIASEQYSRQMAAWDTAVDYGDKLRNARKSRDVSQEAIARELGVSSKTVSRWEQGEAIPLSQRYRICRYFEEPLEWLDAQDFTPPVATTPDWFRAWSDQQATALREIADTQEEILRELRNR